ncbi:hypothetical protein HC891_28395, partial [Candidatus Gracilibacteria bacterium]|nr:hypothetical protein [Candidatus Gracilibacteria bacterium]
MLLYRLQPPLTHYPWRSYLVTVNLALVGLLALRYGPRLALRFPVLLSVLLPTTIVAGWLAAILVSASGHVTLARPGVENDFRVFATRETLQQIFSADGFYNLGYPWLLWLARPLFDGNAFLAARLVAALSGAVLLTATYLIARSLLPPAPALVALVVAALSTMVAQYGLYVGSDMPFAACVALCLALMTFAIDRTKSQEPRASGQATSKPGKSPVLSSRFALIFLAGLAGGCAFLIRHLGLILLPWGVLVIALAALFHHEGHEKQKDQAAKALRSRSVELASTWRSTASRATLVYALGFVLAMLPQLMVNTVQTGQPLYSQQAKNIWFAVYAGTDWARWNEAPNDIGLAEIVLRDPPRFFSNWYRNYGGLFRQRRRRHKGVRARDSAAPAWLPRQL